MVVSRTHVPLEPPVGQVVHCGTFPEVCDTRHWPEVVVVIADIAPDAPVTRTELLLVAKAGRVIPWPDRPRVRVVAVVAPILRVVPVKVSISEVWPPTSDSKPVFDRTNFVLPDAEAANISPLLSWFRTSAALLPIPPEIERGAGVVALPTKTEELKSDEIVVLPLPAEPSVRLPFDVVVMDELPPLPTLILPAEAPIFSVVAA